VGLRDSLRDPTFHSSPSLFPPQNLLHLICDNSLFSLMVWFGFSFRLTTSMEVERNVNFVLKCRFGPAVQRRMGYELSTTKHEAAFTLVHFHLVISFRPLASFCESPISQFRCFGHVFIFIFLLFFLCCIASGFSSKSSEAMFRKTNLVGGEAPSAAWNF
jgi:hypothetical protein